MRSGIDYLNFFKQELSKSPSTYTPFVSIIVPCRGLDIDLEKNLRALFRQQYPHYEVIFVVDSEADEAVSVINKVSREENEGVDLRVVISGKAIDCGQKVHNLREAVLEITDKSEILVFVDSDARPNEKWLSHLIAPLEDKNVGAASGYRWFIQKRGGFATQLRTVWNASIASALGKNRANNFCWGGSTAIRRETFDDLNIREKWKGVLSDDFALTNVLKEAKMPIFFVPQCLTATVEDCKFSELLEFTTRQMKITRVYSPDLFKVSVIGSTLFAGTFWAGIVLLFFAEGFHLWLTLAFVLVIFVFGMLKAWIRLNAVKLVLPKYEKELNRQRLPQILLWTITPILFLYNDIIAMFSQRIIWRGIEYKLESADKTLIKDIDG